jgi:SlyX protein
MAQLGARWRQIMADITALEERMAHLIRAVDDLSDIVAVQSREIDRLTRLTALLAQREAERIDAGQDAPAANAPPPHW